MAFLKKTWRKIEQHMKQLNRNRLNHLKDYNVEHNWILKKSSWRKSSKNKQSGILIMTLGDEMRFSDLTTLNAWILMDVAAMHPPGVLSGLIVETTATWTWENQGREERALQGFEIKCLTVHWNLVINMSVFSLHQLKFHFLFTPPGGFYLHTPSSSADKTWSLTRILLGPSGPLRFYLNEKHEERPHELRSH